MSNQIVKKGMTSLFISALTLLSVALIGTKEVKADTLTFNDTCQQADGSNLVSPGRAEITLTLDNGNTLERIESVVAGETRSGDVSLHCNFIINEAAWNNATTVSCQMKYTSINRGVLIDSTVTQKSSYLDHPGDRKYGCAFEYHVTGGVPSEKSVTYQIKDNDTRDDLGEATATLTLRGNNTINGIWVDNEDKWYTNKQHNVRICFTTNEGDIDNGTSISARVSWQGRTDSKSNLEAIQPTGENYYYVTWSAFNEPAPYSKKKEKSHDNDDSHEESGSSNNKPQERSLPVNMTPEEAKGWTMVGREPVGILSGTTSSGVSMTNAYQGNICQMVFRLGAPGFNIGRTYNINSADGSRAKLTPSRVSFMIPSDLQKTGRQFMMVMVTQNGQPVPLLDKDNAPNTITVDTTQFGAAALMYKD